jgi:hypothetical protein
VDETRMTRIDWATVGVLAKGLRAKYPFLNERDAVVLVAREAGYRYSEIGIGGRCPLRAGSSGLLPCRQSRHKPLQHQTTARSAMRRSRPPQAHCCACGPDVRLDAGVPAACP